jgi:hypothetical protein
VEICEGLGVRLAGLFGWACDAGEIPFTLQTTVREERRAARYSLLLQTPGNCEVFLRFF